MAATLMRLRCACGWETIGTESELIAATQDHGRRLHNMVPTRDEVLAMVVRDGAIADISMPIHPGMVVYAGDPAVHLSRVKSLSHGDSANVSRLDFGVHTGTHVDAPVHFLADAPGADRLALEAMIGPVSVVDATAATTHFDALGLEALAIPAGAERVLFKTTNSALWDSPRFEPRFLGITDDGARWLVDRGLRLVGMDYLSVAPYGDAPPTHRALLEAGIVILEGIDLRAVAPGEYRLVCLPLRLVGADGAPARAVLMPTE
jgi:arylformamidase